MGRAILAVVVGFALWSVLWVTAQLVITPAFGLELDAEYYDDPGALAAFIGASVVCSLVAGGVCAAIDRRRAGRPAVALAVLLLVVGLAVEIAFWSTLPAWYHVTFLVLLVPATLLGARLVAKPAVRPA